MKVIGVIFATVILYTVLAHKPENIDSRNVESVEVGNNAKDDGFEQSELIYVKSIIPNPNGDDQAKVGILRTDDETSEVTKSINDDGLKEEDNEENNTHKTGITDTTNESSISSESDSSYELSQELGKSVFDYLTQMIHESRIGGDSNTNRRLDIEDNGDDFTELVDIDDPKSNDYNQDAIVNSMSNNRAFSNYGARLDMKGRSGILGGIGDPGSPTNMNRDRPLFRPAISRHGLFINPGYYQIANPPPISFTKIESRDILHPINRVNRFPFRRVQGTTDKIVLDVNDNAYQYEPEENVPETQIKPWNYGSYK